MSSVALCRYFSAFSGSPWVGLPRAHLAIGCFAALGGIVVDAYHFGRTAAEAITDAQTGKVLVPAEEWL